MRRPVALFATALFLLTGPGTVAGLIPYWISGWRLPGAGGPYFLEQIAGGALLAAALYVLIESFARFAVQGLGTPVPVFPARRLVTGGWYRYVRNPMYVAVVSAILGQALLFRSAQLGAYALVVWSFFHLFVLLYEEPILHKTFGAEYDSFRARVPRWVPRLAQQGGH